jgi:hypothetical protein
VNLTSEQILERERWAGDNVQQIMLERQTSLDRLFGIEHHAKVERTKGGLSRVVQGERYPDGTLYRHFSSLQQVYVECSGDANINYFGKRVRATQNFALPSFEEMLANTLNRRLMSDYRVDYRWRDIVTAITGPRDFRQTTRARIKYVPDIPSLTEDRPYADLQTPASDDEVVTYTINTTGCYISFSRRLLINNDIGAVERAVAQLSRAASRTIAKRVWALITSNATYGVDGLPIFHANHGNIGTAALSAASLTAARNSLFAQVEPGSTEPLALGGGPLFLVIPVGLESTALPLNHVHFLDQNFTLNPWIHRFGDHNENIFVNPLLVDPNDWYLFDISGNNVGLIEVGFLMGKDQPELMIADNPLADEAFAQDRVIYKLRWEFGCVVLDYRGAYKSVVA